MLREILWNQIREAQHTLSQMQHGDFPRDAIDKQEMLVQALQKGYRTVWLYVDRSGSINWIDADRWRRYPSADRRKVISYLHRKIDKLNEKRAAAGKPQIPHIVPSDFRDMYARWTYMRTNGSVISVMILLGHKSLKSTTKYLDNNILNAEADDACRRFMTGLLQELEIGRVDLTILAQLARHGPLTTDMEARLSEYRDLMRSRIRTGCTDPINPPAHIDANHVAGRLCRTQLCLRDCQNARFLPESLDGIAMRLEELVVLSENLPLDIWIQKEYEKEQIAAEHLLAELYDSDAVRDARRRWKQLIHAGAHVIPGYGIHRSESSI